MQLPGTSWLPVPGFEEYAMSDAGVVRYLGEDRDNGFMHGMVKLVTFIPGGRSDYTFCYPGKQRAKNISLSRIEKAFGIRFRIERSKHCALLREYAQAENARILAERKASAKPKQKDPRGVDNWWDLKLRDTKEIPWKMSLCPYANGSIRGAWGLDGRSADFCPLG